MTDSQRFEFNNNASKARPFLVSLHPSCKHPFQPSLDKLVILYKTSLSPVPISNFGKNWHRIIPLC